LPRGDRGGFLKSQKLGTVAGRLRPALFNCRRSDRQQLVLTNIYFVVYSLQDSMAFVLSKVENFYLEVVMNMNTLFGDETFGYLEMISDASEIVPGKEDGATIEFRTYKDHATGLLIRVRKSSNAPVGAEFLPTKVEAPDGRLLWVYSAEKVKGGLGRLCIIDAQLIIAVVDRRFVHKVAILERIEKGNLIDGLETVLVKRTVADHFRLEPNYSETEDAVIETIRRLEKQKREAEEVRRAEERAAKEAEREAARKARVTEILARGEVSGKTEFGKYQRGVPVVSDEEWPLLGIGKSVVFVDGIGADGSIVGTTGIYFVTARDRGGRPKKQYVAKIVLQRHAVEGEMSDIIAKPAIDLGAYSQVIIDLPKEAAEKSSLRSGYNQLPLVNSDQLADLKAKGLNSGTPVALESSDERAQIVLMTGQSDGRNTIGEFAFVRI